MPKLSKVTLSCPFIVPRSFFQLLDLSQSLSAITFVDMPLTGIMSISPVKLKQISIAPVGQILRIGDGPTDSKYTEHTYYIHLIKFVSIYMTLLGGLIYLIYTVSITYVY
jgi:hypothetical protein